MSKSTVSLLGMYRGNEDLFDDLNLPEDFTDDDTDCLINNLLLETAELEILYTDPNFLQWAIGQWSYKELPTWERIYSAQKAEYNPIENYDRTELTTHDTDGTVTHSGTDSTTLDIDNDVVNSGSDSNAHTGTVTNSDTGTDTSTESVASFDSTTLVEKSEVELDHGKTTTTTYLNTDTITHGHSIATDEHSGSSLTHGEQIDDDTTLTINSHVHGNIGVTTSQQMLESELMIAPKLNTMDYIINAFKNRFCLLVY